MLCFSKILVAKKFIDKKEGEVTRLLLKILCLKVPENAVGEPYSHSIISGIEKIFASMGYFTIFCRNICAPQYRTTS